MSNNEYILRSDALKAVCENCSMTGDEGEPCSSRCEDYALVLKIPAADVEPVIPGRWVSKEGIYGVVYCSICGFELKIDNTPYCSNCGAKMLPEPPMELVDELDETERGANGFGSSGR